MVKELLIALGLLGLAQVILGLGCLFGLAFLSVAALLHIRVSL